MKYFLQDQYYHDFQTINVNRLAPRSYFIPFASAEEASGVSLLEKRYRSSLVKTLNGTWDFIYYDNPNDLPLSFDTDTVSFDQLVVPSCWQFHGYGKPFYLNTRYPFKYNPPEIPTTEPVSSYWSVFDGHKKAPAGEYNHVGVYRTHFAVEDISPRYTISFLGVASCLEVHLNGSFVGYSECSHNTSEFDLTPYLHQGENELLCVVRRWCNSSYLECQDMFRNNGIFRDVLLRKEDCDAIQDINFTTPKTNEGYLAQVEISTYEDIPVSITLCGHGISLTKEVTTTAGRASVQFSVPQALEWNAEYPYLYELILQTKHQYICQQVGFKHINIDGDIYYFNGRAIKFHGVNHHDTSATAGYCMTPQEIERDLKLCKDYNIDTVRTSHYAPDPLLLELAAQLGLYIVDEVDIETHGAQVTRFPPNINAISSDSSWQEHYLDRTRYHYQRDKLLATPIILWSLGNESGAGCNTDATYAYFKEHSAIPVHYESAVHNKKIIAYDVCSEMYPPAAKVASIGKKTYKKPKYTDRPYFLCEYAHAMGVGPGNIEDYWKAIYAYPSLMGGCIWEMVDHAVLEENGDYTYGGDHGEWIHDGNFCCDGIFYPDRTPSTGARIAKHCYTPIRLSLEGRYLKIFNTTGFTEGDQFTLHIERSDGVNLDYTPHCAPLCSEVVDLGFGSIFNECSITIEIEDIRSHVIRDITQFILEPASLSCPQKRGVFPEWFSMENGKPVISLGDTSIRGADEYTLLYRAATDNDVRLMVFHPMTPWYKQKENVVSVQHTSGSIVIHSIITVGTNRFAVTDTYEGCTEGVLVTSHIHCQVGGGYLPRFAKLLRLPESFNNVKWFGCEDETYLDMFEHSLRGEYERPVKEMHEPNIRPQESGNRMDTRYVEVSNNEYTFRIRAVDKPFELGVKPYSDRELISMKHRSDEIVSGTYVAVNAFQQGIGTGSCGSYTLPRHMYKANQDYTLRFVLQLQKNE